jgi:hypothetical protein
MSELRFTVTDRLNIKLGENGAYVLSVPHWPWPIQIPSMLLSFLQVFARPVEQALTVSEALDVFKERFNVQGDGERQLRDFCDRMHRAGILEPAPADFGLTADVSAIGRKLGMKGEPFDLITNAELWRAYFPELTIGGEPTPPHDSLTEGVDWDALVESVNTTGYYEVPRVAAPERVELLRNAVEKLVDDGWPPVFSYLFDEFWELGDALSPLLTRLLGEDYCQCPGVYTWSVRPGQAGFPPHRDYSGKPPREDGRPRNLAAWIPLRDVVAQGSCIYLLPLSNDRQFAAYASRQEPVPPQTAIEVDEIRAMPTPAGGCIGWNEYVMHWSNRNLTSTSRLSCAVEFAPKGETELHATAEAKQDGSMRSVAAPESLLELPPHRGPSWRNRLAVIGHSWRLFSRKSSDSERAMQKKLLALAG